MCNLNKYYGTHLSKSKGLLSLLETMKQNNVKVCQFFTKSPQSVAKEKLKLEYADKFMIDSLIKENDYKVFIHGQYILNLCRIDLNYAVPSIIEDLNYLDNTQGVVIHMGKDTKNLGKQQAFLNMKNNILRILSEIVDKNKYLILETSVKSTNDICKFSSIEGLAELYNALEKPKNIKFCIDTCHIFASGYDIRTIQLFKDFMNLFDKLIGVSNIALFHLNDSKTPLNSGKDRHEILGKGYIFKDNESTLKYILKYCFDNKINIITETEQELCEEKEYLTKIFS